MNNKINGKKFIFLTGVIILIFIFAIIDYTRTTNYKKPLFIIHKRSINHNNKLVATEYYGIGYKLIVSDKVNFMPLYIGTYAWFIGSDDDNIKVTDTINNSPVSIGEKSKYILTNNPLKINNKNETLSNSKATITITNNTEKTYIYGEQYFIEYQKDGIWYEIIPKNGLNFDMIGYILKPGEVKEININWEYFYGKLYPGKYRIIKSFFPEKDLPVNQSDSIHIGAEFIIQ